MELTLQPNITLKKCRRLTKLNFKVVSLDFIVKNKYCFVYQSFHNCLKTGNFLKLGLMLYAIQGQMFVLRNVFHIFPPTGTKVLRFEWRGCGFIP